MKRYFRMLKYSTFSDIFREMIYDTKEYFISLWVNFIAHFFVNQNSDISKVLMKRSGGGSYSVYYQLSNKIGIKILKGSYNTYVEAINSYNMEKAEREMSLQKQCRERFPNIPEVYGVQVIMIDGSFKVGIVMQHIGSQRLSEADMTNGQRYEIIAELEDRFKSLGITHRDIHYGNVMYFKNDWWVIDFTPGYIDINIV